MAPELLFIIPLLIGFLLDTLLGDPLWLPHPIRIFGKAISFFTDKLNSGKYRKTKGMLMALFLISATFWSFGCCSHSQKTPICFLSFWQVWECFMVWPTEA